MKTNQIIQGDALEELGRLPSKSINMLMTSPPYWALRDYSSETEVIWDGKEDCEHEWGMDIPRAGSRTSDTNPGKLQSKATHNRDKGTTNFCSKCGAWKGQLGLEPTFDLYIKHLCDIFDEVKRVLRDDGTCWVNIGDTYYGSGAGTQYEPTIENSKEVYVAPYNSMKIKQRNIDAPYQSKCLVMIPQRFAIEMVNRGWILRNVIIWHKRNCMPSSVKDRFTVDFEYLFFFSKKKNYYFETQYEPILSDYDPRKDKGRSEYSGKWAGNPDHESFGSPRARTQRPNQKAFVAINSQGRNKRTVWSINPQPFGENACMICGYFDKPRSKQQKKGYFGGEDKSERVCKGCGNSLITSHFAVYPEELCETPIKAGCPKDGIVLDPFFGAGTTGLVALKQNKKFIGIELNKEYIEIAKKRLKPFLEQTKL